MGKKNCNSDLAQPSNSLSPRSYVLQSYNAVDDKYKNVEFLTVKTIKSSDDMLAEIKKIASKANHDDEIILHTSEQITKNLVEKIINECENSKKFKKNLHNVQLAFTRSYTQVNRNLASELNDLVEDTIASFALSSLDHVLQTTSTKKNKVAWITSAQDTLVTSQIKAWATQKELTLAVLNGVAITISSGIEKVYAYVTNNHEGEELIEAMKENNFTGSLALVDCIDAFGPSNRAIVATMVANSLLEEANVLQPGTRHSLSEQEKRDLNQDKHEPGLMGALNPWVTQQQWRAAQPLSSD